jgi:hypothetical protein
MGPVERYAFEKQLDGQDSRLAALDEGFHNIGSQVSEPKQSTHVSIAQSKALRNLGGIGKLNLP